MTLKQELYQYKFIKTQLKLKELELDRVRSEYRGISSGGSDGLPSGAISKTVENEVLKKDRREQKLCEEIRKLRYEINKIDTMLEVLTEEERSVIEERYFNNQDFYRIASILNYHFQTVRKYHSNAIKKLSIIYQ